jgi:CRISPR-associated protein Cmr1
MPRLLLTDVPKDSTITATFEIVTPMFLGDADQKATAIRPTAIKGALRFWWRAMNGHLDLKALAEKEAKLFGSTDSGGVFSLVVTSLGKFQAQTDWPPANPPANPNATSSSYMGYGLTGDRQNPHREYIPAGLSFTVTLTFQSSTSLEDRQSVQTALEAFGLFGSLGSRARRGFGSIQLTHLNKKECDAPSKENIKNWFKHNLPKGLKNKSQLEYTAFSLDSYFALPEHIKGKDYKNAHSKMGSTYKSARATIPTKQRAVFGLPLKNVNENLRRASPVFFKVIKHANNSYGALILFMPSQFHPDFTNADYQKIEPFLKTIQAEKCV